MCDIHHPESVHGAYNKYPLAAEKLIFSDAFLSTYQRKLTNPVGVRERKLKLFFDKWLHLPSFNASIFCSTSTKAYKD